VHHRADRRAHAQSAADRLLLQSPIRNEKVGSQLAFDQIDPGSKRASRYLSRRSMVRPSKDERMARVQCPMSGAL
jgi:hypothetical protein